MYFFFICDLLVVAAITGWDPGTSGTSGDIGIGGIIGTVGLGGGLTTYANTPMEKAIRTCLYEAAKYIIENTPQEYFKY